MKKVLKLKKAHPRKHFRIGRHVVGLKAQAFELNKHELEELESKGCKAWIAEIEGEEVKKEEKPKKKAKAKAKKEEE